MSKLTLVSTGAGGSRYLTQEAINAIDEADLIVACVPTGIKTGVSILPL